MARDSARYSGSSRSSLLGLWIKLGAFALPLQMDV